jgi:hypothetical protein
MLNQAYAEAIAVDATSVYWTTNTTVMKVPIGGGTSITLASGQDSSGSGNLGIDTGIAVDATSVYWTNLGAGEVRKVPLDGGASVVLATGTSPLRIAVDDTAVYWTDHGNGTVMKTAK